MKFPPLHPSDAWNATGEMPPGEPGWFQEHVATHFLGRVKAWNEGLPPGHESFTEIDTEEVKAGDIELSLGQKANEFGVRVAHGAGEHQKEIATTLTVAALLLAANRIHSHRKAKK